MSRGAWAALAVLSLAVAAAMAWFVRAPGYMDADYYFATGQQLAEGRGFTEPFLWNYLDDPVGLPHPSHLYWGPLVSLVAAAAMALGSTGFRVAQIPFVLLAAAVPLLTARIALRLGARPGQAWLAGALAAFPGFFGPFLVTTDSFGLYAVLGGLSLVLMGAMASRPRPIGWLAAGLLAGLCHLARADGALFVLVGLAAVGMSRRPRLRSAILLLAGYALILLPWWLRNLDVTGSAFSPGAGRVLWLVAYDDLFSYPASILTFQRWWASGLGEILRARLGALGTNLQTLVAVDGLVFLLPLMAVGAWRQRARPVIRLTALYLVLLYGTMTIVFPYAGARGGVFHSSVAAMPVLWALVPCGLEQAITWGARRRGWEAGQAQRIFPAAAVLLAAAMTLALAWPRLAVMTTGAAWDASQRSYDRIGAEIDRLGTSADIVAVNNPAGFYLATERRAVVIPNGPPETLQAVVERYRVSWVVVDQNLPDDLRALYDGPETETWLTPMGTYELPAGRLLLFRVADSDAEGGS